MIVLYLSTTSANSSASRRTASQSVELPYAAMNMDCFCGNLEIGNQIPSIFSLNNLEFVHAVSVPPAAEQKRT